MKDIPGAERRMAVEKQPGQQDILRLQGPDRRNPGLGETQGGIQSLKPADGNVCVEKLLKNFGRGRQGLHRLKGFLEESPCFRLKRVTPAYRIHKDVGIDEDHASGAPFRFEASMTAKCSCQSGSRPSSLRSQAAKKTRRSSVVSILVEAGLP
jgi:hypothetical protein